MSPKYVSSNQPRIAIAGGDSWFSKGDQAILTATLKMFSTNPENPSINIFTEKPDITRRQYPAFPITYRRNLSAVLKTLENTDLFVWGGGQLVQNISSQAFMAFQLLLLNLAIARVPKVMSYAIGVAEMKGSIWRFLTAAVFNRLGAVIVRDSDSKSSLMDMGVHTPIQVTADPALILRAAPGRFDLIKQEESIKDPFVTIAPRRWFHYFYRLFPSRQKKKKIETPGEIQFTRVVSQFAELADWLFSARGINSVFIPMYPGNGQEDEEIARQIIKKMKHGTAQLLSKDYTPEDLIAVLQESQANIGVRLHSTILATCAGIPSLSIYNQLKGKSFFDQLGTPEFAIALKDLDSQWAITCLKEILSKPDYYREKILKKRDLLSEDAWETTRIAFSLLNN